MKKKIKKKQKKHKLKSEEGRTSSLFLVDPKNKFPDQKKDQTFCTDVADKIWDYPEIKSIFETSFGEDKGRNRQNYNDDVNDPQDCHCGQHLFPKKFDNIIITFL